MKAIYCFCYDWILRYMPDYNHQHCNCSCNINEWIINIMIHKYMSCQKLLHHLVKVLYCKD